MFPIRELQTSLSKPYILGDVKKADFDRFLASLYPRTLWVEEAQTTQDWISILALASKWGFKSLRSRAISMIEQTIDSPIDMVTFGRQYDIPDVLLPGYALLCQSTIPLSDGEGFRLGLEDVLNIYRIRHELYGSGITAVPLEVAFGKVKEAGLGAERPRQEFDGEQASTWADVESVAASQTPIESEERGSVTLMPNVDSPSLDVASTEVATLVSSGPEERDIDVHSPSDEPMSVALGNRGSNVPSCVFPGNASNPNPGSPESDREGFKFLDELTTSNFDLVSVEITQWVNTKDIQTLHQITRLIVEKVMEEPHRSNAYARLCNRMMKDINIKSKKKIAKKPVVKKSKHKVTAGGSLFRENLGEICRENLEAVAASTGAAGEHTAEFRRLGLIGFIGELANWDVVGPQTPVIIDKWVTVLLDANDEEKIATLCMLMTRAGPFWDTSSFMSDWFQRMTDVAQETGNPRVRTLLQDVTKLRERGWAEQRDGRSVQFHSTNGMEWSPIMLRHKLIKLHR